MTDLQIVKTMFTKRNLSFFYEKDIKLISPQIVGLYVDQKSNKMFGDKTPSLLLDEHYISINSENGQGITQFVFDYQEKLISIDFLY